MGVQTVDKFVHTWIICQFSFGWIRLNEKNAKVTTVESVTRRGLLDEGGDYDVPAPGRRTLALCQCDQPGYM